MHEHVRLEDLEQSRQMRVSMALQRLVPIVRQLVVQQQHLDPLRRRAYLLAMIKSTGLDDREACAAADLLERDGTFWRE